MKRLAMLSIFAIFSVASVCRSDELKVGETCFHSDGSSTIQFGDTRFHLDGTTSTRADGTESPCDDLNSVANGEALVDTADRVRDKYPSSNDGVSTRTGDATLKFGKKNRHP